MRTLAAVNYTTFDKVKRRIASNFYEAIGGFEDEGREDFNYLKFSWYFKMETPYNSLKTILLAHELIKNIRSCEIHARDIIYETITKRMLNKN